MVKNVGVDLSCERSSASTCPLCGQANDCAMMLPESERPNQCWCVSATFPDTLTAGLDGTRCVCAHCTAAANASR